MDFIISPHLQKVIHQLRNVEFRHLEFIKAYEVLYGTHAIENALNQADSAHDFRIGNYPLQDHPPGEQQLKQLKYLADSTLVAEAASVACLYELTDFNQLLK